MSDFIRRTKSLHHSASIPPNPQASLSGYFERRTSFWPARRWLVLKGSSLAYHHSRNAQPQWTVDLRECSVSAGRHARELVISRPHNDPLSLFAPSLKDLKLWFAELKRVSDVSEPFSPL